MPVNKFYNIDFMPVELKHGWIADFTTTMKKIEEHKKYDEVWELIKKKNGWS